MTGEEWPSPGSSIFHVRSRSSHLGGMRAEAGSATPEPLGPRKRGQSSAGEGVERARAVTRARRARRVIRAPDVGRVCSSFDQLTAAEAAPMWLGRVRSGGWVHPPLAVACRTRVSDPPPMHLLTEVSKPAEDHACTVRAGELRRCSLHHNVSRATKWVQRFTRCCYTVSLQPHFVDGLMMRNPSAHLLVLLLSLVATPVFAQPKPKVVEIAIREIDPEAAAKVSYDKDVKPILLKHCNECHSSDERRNEFEITSVETLLTRGRKAGPGVVPFKPDQSAIVEHIRGIRQPQMPKGGQPLTEEELHTIRMWIAAGARDDSPEGANLDTNVTKAKATKAAWEVVEEPLAKTILNPEAWQQAEDKLGLFLKWRESRVAKLPPAPTPPQVTTPVNNPIDNFVAAKWQQAGLPSAAQAPEVCDDATYLRRAYLDLVGLVPTVEEANQFLSDNSPGKRERLVDELLARHRDYAINWTPFWEDALGSGAQASALRVRKSYREWLVESFAQNKPYDLFTIELVNRSEERRVGKECRSRRSPDD